MQVSFHRLKDSYERDAPRLKMELHFSERAESWEQCKLKLCLEHFTYCTSSFFSTVYSRGSSACFYDCMAAHII